MGVTMFMLTPASRAGRSSSSRKVGNVAVVVDENIGCGAGGEQGGLAFGAGDVGDHGLDGDAGGLANLRGGVLEQGAIAAVDDQRYAGFGECAGAGFAESLARCAYDGGASANP